MLAIGIRSKVGRWTSPDAPKETLGTDGMVESALAATTPVPDTVDAGLTLAVAPCPLAVPVDGVDTPWQSGRHIALHILASCLKNKIKKNKLLTLHLFLFPKEGRKSQKLKILRSSQARKF